MCRRVAVLRRALLSPLPEEIWRCLPELVEAVQCLRSVEHDLRSQACRDEEVAGELRALRKDLRMVHKLIDHSTAFYHGWANLLGAATAGYVSSGEAATLTPPAAICMEG